jgi:hypothetical protein
MIDFAGISGVAGAFDAIGLVGGAAITEAGSEGTPTGDGLSGIAASFAAAAAATGATAGALWVTGGSAFAGDAGHRDRGAEEVAEADGACEGGLAEVVVEAASGEEGNVEDDTGEEDPGVDDTGEEDAIEEDAIEEDAIEEDAIEEDWGVACGEPAAAVCRVIEPVIESSPCSSTVMREYSRSRSPFRVSMAEASRRVSCWLSLAIDWICCDCRTRSALAICSRRNPIED